MPSIWPIPALPVRVTVLEPAPDAIAAVLVNSKVPVPDMSTVAPAVVPVQARTLEVVSPVPVYRSVPVVVVLFAILMVVPAPTQPGEPLLPIAETLRTHELIAVAPV